MAYPSIMRERVLRFIEDGGSKIEASRVFGVGRATIFLWVNQGLNVRARKPGPKTSHKLDRAKLAQLVQDNPDIMLKELAQALGVSVGAVFHSLKVMGYTRKKNGTLQREKTL
jgi:putative transposase